ncbi:MAG: helix-turn-helix domain-containing protein [Planctomycetota bacterium]
MTSCLLESWSHQATVGSKSIVLPDGCRDLIGRTNPRGATEWFVSDLDQVARQVLIEPNQSYRGFRLRPGTQIDENRIRSLVSELTTGCRDLDVSEIQDRLENACRLPGRVAEAMDALRESRTATAAASACGVGSRHFQRSIKRWTGHSPMFWIRLARVRRSGVMIANSTCLSDAALSSGFADQSHMTREFRRWFGVSPARFARDQDRVARVRDKGFD